MQRFADIRPWSKSKVIKNIKKEYRYLKTYVNDFNLIEGFDNQRLPSRSSSRKIDFYPRDYYPYTFWDIF